MKISTLCLMALLAILCTGCASGQKLKTPCALSGLSSSFGISDCGPLRQVNEAFVYLFNS